MATVLQNIKQDTIFDLADYLKQLKSDRTQMEQDLSDIKAKITETEERLGQLMIEEEMQKFTRAGQTFFLTTQFQCSAVGGKQEELYQVLRDNGAEALIKETVNANSLKAYVKEQIADNDDELPECFEGLVNVYERQIAGMRKG
jgi:hypothetical protein